MVSHHTPNESYSCTYISPVISHPPCWRHSHDVTHPCVTSISCVVPVRPRRCTYISPRSTRPWPPNVMVSWKWYSGTHTDTRRWFYFCKRVQIQTHKLTHSYRRTLTHWHIHTHTQTQSSSASCTWYSETNRKTHCHKILNMHTHAGTHMNMLHAALAAESYGQVEVVLCEKRCNE